MKTLLLSSLLVIFSTSTVIAAACAPSPFDAEQYAAVTSDLEFRQLLENDLIEYSQESGSLDMWCLQERFREMEAEDLAAGLAFFMVSTNEPEHRFYSFTLGVWRPRRSPGVVGVMVVYRSPLSFENGSLTYLENSGLSLILADRLVSIERPSCPRSLFRSEDFGESTEKEHVKAVIQNTLHAYKIAYGDFNWLCIADDFVSLNGRTTFRPIAFLEPGASRGGGAKIKFRYYLPQPNSAPPAFIGGSTHVPIVRYHADKNGNVAEILENGTLGWLSFD